MVRKKAFTQLEGAKMKYSAASGLNEEQFRRLVGIRKLTFEKIVTILDKARANIHSKHGGRKPKLSIPDSLMMSLMYWRENRTYFHVGKDYGLSESSCWKTVKWVEDTVIRDGAFSLPGKKKLLEGDNVFEVVLIDATETPIERPKKSNDNTILARRKDTH